MQTSTRIIEHITRDERLHFLKTSVETGGAFTLIEVDLGPCNHAPAHRHEVQSEVFEVVSGVLEVTVDGKTTRIAAGEEILAPGGTVHSFGNPGPERCVYRVRITPGNTGWENMMRISWGLLADGETWGDIPKDFTTIAVLATMGQASLPGPFALFNPLLKWRAASDAAKQRGHDLIKRYGGTPMDMG